MTHLFRISAATGCIILLTALPFLPGRYDSLALPLSLMAQVFGKVGLLLVPVSLLWWAGLRRAFALSALVASSFVWIIVSFAAFTESLLLGLGMIALGVYLLVRIVPRRQPMTSTLPLAFVIVPLAVFLIQLVIADPLAEFSRSRAIRNSAPLINDIEQYRIANGRYPVALVSVHQDYAPALIGIKEYRYELNGAAYNISFEQSTFRIGTREFVMYNPRDEQAIAAHALDVLQLTPEQLELDRTRGHNAVHHARQPHWKYFWFD
jgi:hypothetical protein